MSQQDLLLNEEQQFFSALTRKLLEQQAKALTLHNTDQHKDEHEFDIIEFVEGGFADDPDRQQTVTQQIFFCSRCKQALNEYLNCFDVADEAIKRQQFINQFQLQHPADAPHSSPSSDSIKKNINQNTAVSTSSTSICLLIKDVTEKIIEIMDKQSDWLHEEPIAVQMDVIQEQPYKEVKVTATESIHIYFAYAPPCGNLIFRRVSSEHETAPLLLDFEIIDEAQNIRHMGSIMDLFSEPYPMDKGKWRLIIDPDGPNEQYISFQIDLESDLSQSG